MVAVRAMSPHLMFLLVRLSIAPIHRKNRTKTIPGIEINGGVEHWQTNVRVGVPWDIVPTKAPARHSPSMSGGGAGGGGPRESSPQGFSKELFMVQVRKAEGKGRFGGRGSEMKQKRPEV